MAEKKKSKITLIYSLSVLIGFAQALLTYIASSYFKILSGREDVSIFYLISFALALMILINLHKLVSRIGKMRILKWSLFLEMAAVAGLLFFDSAALSIGLLIVYFILESITFVAIDIILESYSKDSDAGRVRGIYMTVFNAGFIAGPLLSTYLVENYDYAAVFFVILVLKALILATALTGMNQDSRQTVKRETVAVLLKKAWANKSVMKIYYISFALEFFYALMIIYSPIYLRNLGVDWQDIGFIFAFMLIPFLVFEYPIGWLADKKWGEKEMIILFLTWMGISTALIYLIKTPDISIWLIALLSTRIGAASIAILRDSYFYKKINSEDVDLIDFFRTAAPVGNVVGAFLSVALLSVASVREIFLLTAIVVFSSLVPALKLEDNLGEEQKTLINAKVKAFESRL